MQITVKEQVTTGKIRQRKGVRKGGTISPKLFILKFDMCSKV